MTPARGRDAHGQGLVEYGLVIAGIALVATILLVFFGDQVAEGLELLAAVIAHATR